MTTIHPLSDVQSRAIGESTKVWQFCVVLPGARIGRECNINSHVFIENDVVLGDRVTIKCGVQLWDGTRLENDVFVGPNVTFTNDSYPRSKQQPKKFPVTTLKSGCSIGANSTILPGVTIGAGAMIGSGTVVTGDVPPNAIVVGNPGQITGYMGTKTARLEKTFGNIPPKNEIQVRGASLHNLTHIPDLRGDLCAAQLGDGLPFESRRFFLIYNVPTKKLRGEHAHRECHQFLICVRGSVNVMMDDGEHREEVILDQPNIGLWLKPWVWGVQYKYTEDALLLVMASHEYDADDYIRDYDEFLQLVQSRGNTNE